ncbi:MAG: hypothetical protein CL975_03885 [Euryarchaeota archaeon]|nr:hypothetical protein [Euryarchaeota archaeon]
MTSSRDQSHKFCIRRLGHHFTRGLIPPERVPNCPEVGFTGRRLIR